MIEEPKWNNYLRTETASPQKPRLVRRYMFNHKAWCWVCYRPNDGVLSGVGVDERSTWGAYYDWQYS